MNMHKQHPQRCLHSHICKFNGNNYQDCINTDCTSHRYTYNFQSERDNQQDTTYELCNFWKLHACKSMTTNNCWNKSCPDHDEYGSPCSFQSERDKVLEVISELERCIKPDDSLWAHYTPNEIVELLKTAVKAELRQAGE